MLNTKVHIFTYGTGGNENNWSWKTVVPDPDMAPYSEFGPGTVSEMYLYNSDSTHFDLRVENNSRLAVMGFISIGEETEVERIEENKTKAIQSLKESQGPRMCSKEQWQTKVSTKDSQDNNTNSCQTCIKRFPNRRNLLNHMNEHKTSKTHKNTEFHFSGVHACDKCDAVFITNFLLMEHDGQGHENHSEIEVETHESNDRPVAEKQQLHCALDDSPCSFQCETREELKQHIDRTHRGKTDLQCDVCNLFFRDLDDLSNHMNMVHRKSDDDIQSNATNMSEYSCRNCLNAFNNNNELNQHIITEHKSYKTCRNFYK